jgi:hypothetical protein
MVFALAWIIRGEPESFRMAVRWLRWSPAVSTFCAVRNLISVLSAPFLLLVPGAQDLQLLPVVGALHAPSLPLSHPSPSRERCVGREACHREDLATSPICPLPVTYFREYTSYGGGPIRRG